MDKHAEWTKRNVSSSFVLKLSSRVQFQDTGNAIW